MLSRRPPRSRFTFATGALFVAFVLLTATNGPERLFAQAPPSSLIAGRNVNMVSGTEWPNGDPFLQRQNEPSLAASTRNPQHLLGGSNDYRTIDLPGLPDGGETGDAWLGLYKSFDGGDRWQSTLLPGYPQDTSPAGLASPLKGFQAGADPVVRAGTNGLFYYSGIVFDRTAPTRSRVFVARFIDNNNKEAGDPIAYLGTSVIASDSGTTGAFIDKPWMAVDVPRNGARVCQISAPGTATVQSIRSGDVYVAYSVIEGTGTDIRSTIMFASSSNCGVTWTRPVAISNPTDRVNQGATIAIDPRTGEVHVAWRQFGLNPADPDSISIVSAKAGGKGFKKAKKVRQFMAHHTPEQIEKWLAHKRRKQGGGATPVVTEVAEVDSFDQPTLEDRFRTNSYPTMTVDAQGRVYVAWTERGFGGFNNNTLTGDARIVLATSPDGENWGAPFAVDDPAAGSTALPGHQFMPSIAFAGGKLTLAYYDLREDVSGVFGQYVDEGDAVTAANRRHTIDIRATQADPGDAPAFEPSIRVSQYLVGSRRGSGIVEQLQFNPPNLPLFQLGTVPFIGDYLDLAPSPAFVQNAQGAWAFNTAPSGSPVFHVAWTDNRDVRPPTDGDWTNYTPPSNPFSGVACNPNFTASRNQNVYTSKLTTGLLAGSPGNAKPLSPTLPRGFVVFAQNTTGATKTFRFTIANQPPGGRAEFSQLPSSPLLLQVDAMVPARSSVSRTVYVVSSDPDARVTVDIREVTAPGGAPVSGGLEGAVILNPDIANPDIANPDIANPDIANPDIANAEVYNPDIANPDIANPDIANPDIANPDIANPDIANPDIANPDIANPDIANPDIANPDIANPDIANPDIANPDIANGSLTDVTWTITNTGNTAATFDVDLFFKNNPVPNGIKTQLILYRTYKTPVASASTNCELKLETQNVIVANIINPVFNAPGTELAPDPANSSASNATMWIEPGGSAKITLRIVDPNPADNQTLNPVDDVAPVVTSEAYNTPDIAGGTPPPTPPPTTQPQTSSVPTLSFFLQPAGAMAGLPMPSFTVRALGPGGGLAGVPVTVAIASNPSGGALGGTTTVVTNGSGLAYFTDVIISRPGSGYTLVASSAAANAVPAISLPVVIMPPGLVVTNANNSGAGSLREAIGAANGAAGSQTITFNIPGAGPASPTVITVTSPLPAITDPVVIDATTQPGYDGKPVVELAAAETLASGAGLLVSAGDTTIRGLAITGFPEQGVFVFQFVTNVLVEGNYIGTDRDGSAKGNDGSGVQMRYATGSTVQANVLSANGGSGMLVEGGSGNRIASNEIGTTPGGLAALPNAGNGITIYLDAAATTIESNVISGNTSWGIELQRGTDPVAGTQILGNIIGLARDGSMLAQAAPGTYGNLAGGVRLIGTEGSVLGTPGHGNFISGNNGPGVVVSGQSTITPEIKANYIGTDLNGTQARRNIFEGVVLEAPALVGGSTDSGDGNLISGNGVAPASGAGVLILGEAATGAVVTGNFIGTTIAGTAPLGNGYSGITITNVSGVTVGGTESDKRNVISGNAQVGIAIYPVGAGPQPSNVTIQGNYIGTDVSGTTAVPNGGDGISVDGTAVQIGGLAVESANLLMGNVSAGVRVGGASGGVSILSNIIEGNGGPGIDLGGTGVTPNDPGDADTGPNGLQNFPVMAAAVNLQGQSSTTVNVSFDSVAGGGYTLQYFGGPTCNAARDLVLTAPGVLGSTIVEISPQLPVGTYITATATDGGGNTSELAACARVTTASLIVPGTAGGAVNVNSPGAGGTHPVVVASVQPGDYLTISASGTYSNGLANYGPAGNGTIDPGTTSVLAPALPQLALIGRIAGGPWQVIGPGPTTLAASGAGVVELAVNDNYFADNTGALAVEVSVSTTPPAPAAVITSASPASAAPGDGFIVFRGSNLPIGQAVFNDGAQTASGFVFLAPSTSSAVYVRLPTGLAIGPGTVQLKNGSGTIVSNTFSLNVSSTPGTPIVTGVYYYSPFGTPATTVSVGQQIVVAADGIDTTGRVVRFQQGAAVFDVSPASTVSNTTLGVGALVAVPAGLTPGPVSVSIRQGASAFSAVVTLTVQ